TTDAQKAKYVRMVDQETRQGFNLQPQEIDHLQQESGEKNLRGRTGGAVTLALGIAKIFDGIPGLRGLMKYWYHFAIMFEALFICWPRWRCAWRQLCLLTWARRATVG